MKLQEELGLQVNADIPMVAFIGRLDPQKGADILLQVRAPLVEGAVGLNQNNSLSQGSICLSVA